MTLGMLVVLWSFLCQFALFPADDEPDTELEKPEEAWRQIPEERYEPSFEEYWTDFGGEG